MAKTRFVCQECGNVEPKWQGKCPACNAWNSFIEEQSVSRQGGKASGKALEAVPINSITKEEARSRLETKLGEVDLVLGGGIVPGSLVLLAGEPGVGKSTLLLQVASALAGHGSVLYVSGEESLRQVKLRADRLGVTADQLQLLAATNADDIAQTISASNYEFVIIDSIQTMATDSLAASAGTVSQISASAQAFQNVAKQTNTAILLVGHVTKEGNIAGPKILEHLVDVVLYLEGERFGNFKILRSVKNRFGSTYEVGIFEMAEQGLVPVANPSAAFLEERQPGDGSVVFAALEGSRALLVEVQALVSSSSFGYPKRTAVGFDLNRLNLLLAVLSKRANVNLSASDVYVNIVGGLRLNEPAADLAVALAIASAAKGKTLKDKTVVFGELGLNGEVRSVVRADTRTKEAKKLGFNKAIGPKSDSDFIIGAANISEAIAKGLA